MSSKLSDVETRVQRSLISSAVCNHLMWLIFWTRIPFSINVNMYSYLHSYPISVINNNFLCTGNLFQGFSIAPATWGPSLDVQSTKKPFFSDNPSNLVEQGKLHDVAYLIGITKEDGLFYTGALHNRPDIEDHLRYLWMWPCAMMILINGIHRNNWDDCMTTNLFGKRLEHVTSKDVELLRTIEKFYFGEKRTEFNPETFSNVTDLFTDFAFAFPADLTVRSATRHLKSKVYYHRLDISEGFSNFNLYGLSSWSYLAGIVKFFLRIYPKARGCSHGDEIKYLFKYACAQFR